MVKCCQCGFLCARHAGTGVLSEVHDHWRQSGQLPRHLYDITPLCFVQEIPIGDEMAGVGGGDQARPDRFVQIISKERDCSRFLEWVQGFSPKEHREMLHEKTMLEAQERQREKERQWQEDQRVKERAWQEGQKKSDRIWGALAAIVAAIAGGIVGWLASR